MGDHPELETESRREGGKGKQRVRGARWWVLYHQAKAPGACPSARLTLSRFHPAQQPRQPSQMYYPILGKSMEWLMVLRMVKLLWWTWRVKDGGQDNMGSIGAEGWGGGWVGWTTDQRRVSGWYCPMLCSQCVRVHG